MIIWLNTFETYKKKGIYHVVSALGYTFSTTEKWEIHLESWGKANYTRLQKQENNLLNSFFRPQNCCEAKNDLELLSGHSGLHLPHHT